MRLLGRKEAKRPNLNFGCISTKGNTKISSIYKMSLNWLKMIQWVHLERR